jgi:cell division protein FtsW (lipid II flippase)
MTMNYEVERIRRVTSNYFFWQGLRWVPIGLVVMALGLRRTNWSPIADAWEDTLILCLIVLVMALSPLIGVYYRRSFGDVRDDPDAHQRREMMKWLLVYPLMILSLVIDMKFKPAFFVTGPVWCSGILAYWLSTGRGRPHYLIASMSM